MTPKAKLLDRLRSRIEDLILPSDSAALPVRFVEEGQDLEALLGASDAAWLLAQGWIAEAGALALLPHAEGGIGGALFGVGKPDPDGRAPLFCGSLPTKLPAGDWRLPDDATELDALAWLIGAYRFERYWTKGPEGFRRLALPKAVDRDALRRAACAIFLGRDLINTPANDLGPADLEVAAREIALAYGAEVKVVAGSDLLAENFPMIHAVGRASDREPRLIELNWGERAAKRVTLVGKGICFDTGGLNIKPASAMGLMKKDMGGAASVLALASMIMDAGLPLCLRVLIPSADNNISANAFRPGDILISRSGTTVEIGNTDAEGRLVLADALTYADEAAPDLIVCMATLTGAARVALGPDLPPLYTDDDALAEGLIAAGKSVGDPFWRMPLWRPYDTLLKSRIADVNHISDGSFAGSITAALFLRRFVTQARRFVHLDIYGWTPRAQAGKPEGGEPQGARALFAYLEQECAA